MKIAVSPARSLSSPFLLELIGVGIAGFMILILAYLTGFPKLSISDEIVYAVMGRNIADFRGPYTNFYWPESIIEKGYPLGDVHLPGYMFILSLFFFLFGPQEFVAFLPSQLAFILAGVVVYGVGKIAFSRQVGFWAALWFFLLPTNFIWANTAMTEATLSLLSAAFLWVWYRAVTAPRLTHSIWLAVLMLFGMFCRELFFIFIIPTVYALWTWPKPARRQSWLVFGSLFLGGILTIFIPFYLKRAPYPHVFSDLLNVENSAELWALVLTKITKNLRESFEFGLRPDYLSRLTEYMITLLVLISLGSSEKTVKKLSWYYLITFLPVLFLMGTLHLIYQWFVGLRLFAMFMPAGIIAACGFLSSLSIRGKSALAGGAIILLVVSLWMNSEQRRSRQEEFGEQSLLTEAIIEQTSALSPGVIMADHAFLYGWQHYPVTVIWKPVTHLDEWQKLRERIRVDVVVVQGEPERDKIMEAMKRYPGIINDKFTLLNQQPVNGFYVFARQE